jgi:Tol biopolymer transport system component
VKPDASGLRQLTERMAGNEGNLLYPIFSPAGDRLVASRLRASETILIDPRREWKAQKPEILPMTISEDSWLAPKDWSPDGRRLLGAVTSSAGSTVGVGVYDVAARTARTVASGQPEFGGVVWLPDSRRAVYVDYATDTLWLLDVDTGRRKALAAGLNLGLGLTASPDGRTLFASLNRQQADLWLTELSRR